MRYSPKHDKWCTGWRVEEETCGHVQTCNKVRQVDLLHKLVHLVDSWLKGHGTDPRLRKCLVSGRVHEEARKGVTRQIYRRQEQEIVVDTASIDSYHWLDKIYGGNKNNSKGGWRFSVNELSKEVGTSSWKIGERVILVTRLLEVSHGQWLYWNVHVHDALIGDPALMRNEDIRTGRSGEDWWDETSQRRYVPSRDQTV